MLLQILCESQKLGGAGGGAGMITLSYYKYCSPRLVLYSNCTSVFIYDYLVLQYNVVRIIICKVRSAR